jgi:hypothetical protein
MTLPEDLIYVSGFLAEAEERDVVGLLATFELQPYVLHDTPSRRLVRSFGVALVAGAYDAGPAAPIPAELEWLRERCAALKPTVLQTLPIKAVTSANATDAPWLRMYLAHDESRHHRVSGSTAPVEPYVAGL